MNPNRSQHMVVRVEQVSPEELYNVLTAASSQDPALLQASSTRLKEMLEMFGTYDALHEISATRILPLAVRQQAIIQFKNAALNHWKSRKVLSDQHRVRIRQRCLAFLDEEDETIAQCNEVVMAKLARHDYPQNWGSLLQDLMQIINNNLQQRYVSLIDDAQQTLHLRRTLRVLDKILKEFGAMKMLNGMKIMAKVVDDLKMVLYGYYTTMSTAISTRTPTPSSLSTQRIHDDIMLTHLVYKCVIKMGVWLWHRLDKISKEEQEICRAWINELFQHSASQLRLLVESRTKLVAEMTQAGKTLNPTARRTINVLTRHIRTFGKYFRRLQQLQAGPFVLLPDCSDLILYYWSKVVEATSGPADLVRDADDAVYPVRYLVQGMVLFRESLSQWVPIRRNGVPNENSLSPEFVETAVRLLITRFMPLNPGDLERWMADPEEWVNVEDKENDMWEYEIRPCSERVLMTLSSQYPELVTQLLASTFNQIASQHPSDLQTIVQKEALYCAVGRCAPKLKDAISFEDWLAKIVPQEAQSTDPNYPIIKRRIAWVIGKWVQEDCASPNNTRIWETLVHLLKDRGPGTDPVVRFTAVVALKDCLDSLEFNPASFEPFLSTAILELLTLMGEADSYESKRRVDLTLNILIEQVKEMIIPFISIITAPIPELWTEAGDQWLFKTSLLDTVAKLIESIGAESTNLGNIVIPLLQDSLQPPACTNLDEDALTLWQAALRNTMTIAGVNGAPGLCDLLPQAIHLLSVNFDLLGSITRIMESYFVLDGAGILRIYNTQLLTAFTSCFTNSAVVSVNATGLVKALNLLFQTTPSNLWGEALYTSGLFDYIMTAVLDGELSAILITELICLIARIIIADRQMFLQLVSAMANAKNFKDSYIYENLTEQWYAKFDNMSEPRHRKLAAMGISALVTTGRPEVLQRLPVEIFNLWVDVFCEIKEASIPVEGDDTSSLRSPDNLRRHWELEEAPSWYYQNSEGTPEYDRRKAIYDADPVRTIHLGEYVGQAIREVEASLGAAAFQAEYLSKAEPAVLKQIQAEVSRV